MKKIVCTVLFFCMTFFLFAQSTQVKASAVIIYADGGSFDVIHQGKRIPYDIGSGDVVDGMELYTGDMINTYGGTFLELQLTPSENVVKVSENTSFTVESTDASGGGSFSITYGRVRATVTKLFGLERFKITGPSMVAGVRGTDFGFDSIISKDSSGELISRVYCFKGTVAVENKAEGSGKNDVSEPVLIHPGEMAVETSGQQKGVQTPSLKVLPILPEIKNFWSINDFKGTLIQEKPPEILPKQKISVVSSKRKDTFGHAAVWTGTAGVLLEAVGTALYFSSDIFPGIITFDNKTASNAFFISGGVMFGGSLLSLIGYLTAPGGTSGN